MYEIGKYIVEPGGNNACIYQGDGIFPQNIIIIII